MKQCNRCHENKSTECFPLVKGNKYIGPYCNDCLKVYDREFYARTIETRRERKKINQKALMIKTRQYVWDYLSLHPCIDCGETDPVLLEFDHISSETKKGCVSELVNRSLRVVQAEIDKCEVRCANCHRRKTALQLGWYKDIQV